MNDISQIYAKAANEARGLAIDAIADRKSGHLGLPLGCAEIGAVLFGEVLSFDPAKPSWLNRDRFVLSAGHGSMFLYSWLHISGYDLTLEDLSKFRVMGSKTPGHPEFGETPGVEVTSGPLGQGVANAIGMALSQKAAAARFNTESFKTFDHKVFCLAGDGCMQEGVSSEACAFAAHQKLDNFILLYDSNRVTLDEMASKTQSEDVKKRFEAYGFEVFAADGHDIAAVRKVFKKARKENGKPKLIIFSTIIAKGIPEVENSAKGHGEGGAKFADAAKAGLGLPNEKYYVSDDTYAFYAKLAKKRARIRRAWEKSFKAWGETNPALNEELDAALSHKGMTTAQEVLSKIPEAPAGEKSATRISGGKILNAIAKAYPCVITGSADLFGSTKNYINGGGDFSAQDRKGRNIWYGIREHAMGAITNGIAYYGLFTPSCATFLTFAGYMLPPVRIAALAKLGVQYFFTHDSVGVGFDGPTHQPVELVAQLRCIPRLNVIRPADAEECAAALALAYARRDGPTALILSRQDLPDLPIPVQTRRLGTLKGAYVAKSESAPLAKIIIATGSELQHAIKAAESDASIRVVSMPCMEIFELQDAEYKAQVLPESCQNRVAIEAGVSGLWYKYARKVIATDDFGFSADTPELFAHFKINAQSCLDA